MSLTLKPAAGKRPFVMSPYVADERGVPRPRRPRRCPYALPGVQECRLHILRWRKRVRGPGFLLCAMECLDHGHSFTVHPVAWPPWARQPVAALDYIGRFVAVEPGESRWSDTAFAAVVDADAGALWPDAVTLGPPSPAEDCAAAKPRCRRTQRRHVAGAMRLFALDTAGTRRERETVALAVKLPLTLLESAAQRIRDGPSLAARGWAGASVLQQLPQAAFTVDGLLRLGTTRGFWGPALTG